MKLNENKYELKEFYLNNGCFERGMLNFFIKLLDSLNQKM